MIPTDRGAATDTGSRTRKPNPFAMHISTQHALDSQAPSASQARVAQSSPPVQEARKETNPNAQDPREVRSPTPTAGARRLDEADLRQVQELKARDREVRAHEQAHVAAGGSLVRGGANYTFAQGPDGRRYAVGGEVQIDTAKVPGDPEATAERAEQVRRAALAPATPSAQDRAVASRAAALAAQSRAEAAQERAEETSAEPARAAGESRDAAGQGTPSSERTTDTPEAAARAGISAYEQVASFDDAARSQRDDRPAMTV